MPLPFRAAAAPLALLLAAGSAAAQAAPEHGAFVTRMGSDTLAVESYTRTARELRGRLVVRSPRTAFRDYAAALRPDGSISRFEVSFGSPGAPPTQHAVIELGRDSAVTTLRQGDSTRVFRVATPHPSLPFLNLSYALAEQAMLRARAARVDSAQLDLVAIGAPQPLPYTLVRHGRAVKVLSGSGLAHAVLDARGRIASLDGAGSTQQVQVSRVPRMDVDAFAAASARHDRQAGAMGMLSPRDTVRASVGAARVMVDYGRPGRRGRAIFGQVVPWNEVWRTGANAATQLSTDRDLVIGGAAVPAGTYTLWTLPSATGWKLIINRQTGQWGTEYDAGRDLVRVDMARTPASPPVERFTITVEPSGAGGVLAFAWDDTRVTVPVTVP